MPIATPEIYSEMIDRAKAGGYASPRTRARKSLLETVEAFGYYTVK